MSQDNVKLKGKVVARLYDQNGNLKQEQVADNLVVTAGKQQVAALIAGEAPDVPSHIAIGTSSTAASVGQTALVGTELAREAASVSRTGADVEIEATFAAGTGTGTIEEAGIFNAASSGTMLARFLTGSFAKGASDALTLTWTLTVG